MRLPSLLLVLLLLSIPLAAKDATPPAAQPLQFDNDGVWSVDPELAQSFILPAPKANLAGDSDGICYKIRAYIFKRDDDHAPELKGSTTCVPGQPKAKEVVWPKARLVPAD